MSVLSSLLHLARGDRCSGHSLRPKTQNTTGAQCVSGMFPVTRKQWRSPRGRRCQVKRRQTRVHLGACPADSILLCGMELILFSVHPCSIWLFRQIFHSLSWVDQPLALKLGAGLATSSWFNPIVILLSKHSINSLAHSQSGVTGPAKVMLQKSRPTTEIPCENRTDLPFYSPGMTVVTLQEF